MNFLHSGLLVLSVVLARVFNHSSLSRMDSSPTLSAFSRADSEESGSARRHLGTFSRIVFPARGAFSIPWGEQTLSSVAGPITLWLFVWIFMIAAYQPQNVWIGPNSSILVQLNPFLVQSVKVEDLDDSHSGLDLYGFHESPPLDAVVNWSQSYVASVPHRSYKEWPFYLNPGASLNISYHVKPQVSSVQLVVGKGMAPKWIVEEGVDQTAALSWNLVRGSGAIEVMISESSNYYVAVANSHMKDIKVELGIDVSAVVYDTQHSFYKCAFQNGKCTFNVMPLSGKSIVLTSGTPKHGASSDEDQWYVRFSYQARWITYLIGTGLVACLTLIVIKSCERDPGEEYISGDDIESSPRAYLLGNKEEDGSSDESLATEDADLKEFVGGEDKSLCAICFDAPKDCFFLPCGHSISCYLCGTKVAEASGTCPICRRKLKKVQRIYAV